MDLLAGRIRALPGALEAAAARSVRAAAELAAGEARMRAPVDSGALRAGIGVQSGAGAEAAEGKRAPFCYWRKVGRPGEGMPFGKGSPSPVPPSPRKLLFWSVPGNLRAVSLPSATVPGGAAAPVRRPYPGIPERMGALAWLHCRS